MIHTSAEQRRMEYREAFAKASDRKPRMIVLGYHSPANGAIKVAHGIEYTNGWIFIDFIYGKGNSKIKGEYPNRQSLIETLVKLGIIDYYIEPNSPIIRRRRQQSDEP